MKPLIIHVVGHKVCINANYIQAIGDRDKEMERDKVEILMKDGGEYAIDETFDAVMEQIIKLINL